MAMMYGKKGNIFSMLTFSFYMLKKRGRYWSLRSCKRFLNARLKLVQMPWNRKRHFLPECDSSMNKFVRNADRTTGVSLLTHQPRSSAKNLVCSTQMRSPGFWSSFLLTINKFKACRKWVVLSISGYDLFWQIALPDLKWQRWSVVRHQSHLRIWEKETKIHVNIGFGNTNSFC